jgi:hypothetical protein
MTVYKKIYHIAISAVEIRRLYSTYLKNLVSKAEMMNHSYEENKKYAY